jgi:type I restriction enzyme S subunit
VRSLTDAEENHNVIPEDLSNYRVAHAGDLVINKMKAWQGSMGIAPCDGIVSPAYYVFDFRIANHDFGQRLLRSKPYVAQFGQASDGVRIGQWDLSLPGMRQIPVLLPPPAEQAAIVRFLDWATGRLDRAVRAKRKLIALLNEQKQAIIHRAVTRGLDPSAPLKPSGIPWLGEVPEHWEVATLRRYWTVTDCKHLTVPFVDDGVPLASVVEVQQFSLDLRRCKRTTPEWYRRLIEGGRKPALGDLIYCRNASVGACAIVDAELDFAMGQDVCLIRSQAQSQRFLNYLLHSPFMKHQLELLLVGSTFKRINISQIKALAVIVPPRHEQDTICEWLDACIATFQVATRRLEREIELLREYRTRLVADVVTGKLDVRDVTLVERDVAPAKKLKGTANIYFRRAVFGAEIVHRLHKEPTFGHVKFEKLVFLCEKRCGVDTGSTYRRRAAGPYDNRALRSIDSQMKERKWYESHKGRNGYRYVPLERAGGHKDYFDRYFGHVLASFDEIVNTFRTQKTDRCEIVATLYAAWEDLLAQGEATDDQIIREVLDNWHPSKKEVAESRWRRALQWMKDKNLFPAKPEA